MKEERKNIIRFSLDYDIVDIHTYSGYKGDLIVRITTRDRDAVKAIREYALSLGIKEVVIKQNKDMLQFEIYCVTEDEGVYHLKIDDLLHETHEHHKSDDKWDIGHREK